MDTILFDILYIVKSVMYIAALIFAIKAIKIYINKNKENAWNY